MMPVSLSTIRLHLRSACESDPDDLFQNYCSNPTSSRFLTRKPHGEITQTSQFINQWCHAAWNNDSQAFAWIVAFRNTNKAIGLFLVTIEDHKAQIHYGLGLDYQGQGLMTEAGRAVVPWLLDHDSIQRVWTVCDLENYASIKVLEKLGFINEGILQKWLILPAFGRIARDCYSYALIS